MEGRTFDLEKVEKIVNSTGKALIIEDFSIRDWLEDNNNIAILKEEDLALFEFSGKGVYQCHWIFESRGRKALVKVELIVREMFDNAVEVLWGLTPVDLLAARWFNRQLIKILGGHSLGIIEMGFGPQEIFVLTKKELRG